MAGWNIEYEFNNGIIGEMSDRPDGLMAITLDSKTEDIHGAHEAFLKQMADSLGMFQLHYYDAESPEIVTNLKPNELLGELWTHEMISEEEMMSAYENLKLTPSIGRTSCPLGKSFGAMFFSL